MDYQLELIKTCEVSKLTADAPSPDNQVSGSRSPFPPFQREIAQAKAWGYEEGYMNIIFYLLDIAENQGMTYVAVCA